MNYPESNNKIATMALTQSEVIKRATTGTCPSSKRSKTSSSPSSIEPVELTELRWPQLCSSYKLTEKISVIHAMLRQESTTYKAYHYLEDTIVTEQDRSSLCAWGYGITTACNMNPKVAAIAIGYFDRFMSKRNTRAVEACLAGQREFQLAFIACFIITVKGREKIEASPKFVAERICEGMYAHDEIINMEINILRTLGWYLNGPSIHDFIEHFMDLLPPDADKEAASNLQQAAMKRAEKNLHDYSLALEPPSSLALASLTSIVSTWDPNASCDLKYSAWMSKVGFIMGVFPQSPENQDVSLSADDIFMLSRRVSED